MNQTDWARLHQAGVPIETIAAAAGVPTTAIEERLEKLTRRRAQIRTQQDQQGPAKKPTKRKKRRVKNPRKTCESCQKTFRRPRLPNGNLVSLTNFAGRRYCSHACADVSRRLVTTLPDTKICRHCQVEFPWPFQGNPKSRISAKSWATRLYCTEPCRRQSQSQLFAAARAPIPPQPMPPQMALFRILPPVAPAPGAESDAEYLIRLCGGEAA